MTFNVDQSESLKSDRTRTDFRSKVGTDFNRLPENISTMNTEHVEFFKNHFDVFLTSVPDKPIMTGEGLFLSTQVYAKTISSVLLF